MVKQIHAPLENDQDESYDDSKPSTVSLVTFTETLTSILRCLFHLNQSTFDPTLPKPLTYVNQQIILHTQLRLEIVPPLSHLIKT